MIEAMLVQNEVTVAPWMITVFISLILFMIVHLGAAIWFASKMNTQISGAVKTVEQLCVDVKAIAVQEGRLGIMDVRILGLEERHRELRGLVMKLEGSS